MLHRLFFGVLLAFGFVATSSSEEKQSVDVGYATEPVTLEEMFPKRSLFGTTASSMAFSHDGKYAAYLYRKYENREDGADLWLLNTKDGTIKQITSIDMMAKFQESTRRLKDTRASGGAGPFGKGFGKNRRMGGEDTEEKKIEEKKGDDKKGEKKDEKIDEKKVDEKKVEIGQKKLDKKGTGGGGFGFGGPRYTGISSFVWSPNGDELLFGSQGDIYRWKVGDAEPSRLTMTKAFESGVEYLPDGKGYSYRNGEGLIIRVTFGSHLIEQIDPFGPRSEEGGRFRRPEGEEDFDSPQEKKEEEKKQEEKRDERVDAPIIARGESLAWYKISPDGKKIALMTRTAAQTSTPERKVAIASYRDRFMKIQEYSRQVSDDPVPPDETKIYLYEIGDPTKETGFLSRVFEYKTATPRDLMSRPSWSPDSQKVTFSLFRKEAYQVEIYTAQLSGEAKSGAKRERAKPAKMVYKFQHNGGPTTPDVMDPEFISDSKRLVFITEISGFRHLHLFDPVYESLDQLTSGRGELTPIGIAKDHKSYFVSASRESSCCRDVYQITFEDRSMKRLTKEKGCYANAEVSNDGKQVLANFVRFGALEELVHIKTDQTGHKVLTDSHPETAKKVTKIVPEFFKYDNRNGQEIHGFLFKPADWKKTDKRPLLIYVYGGPLGSRYAFSKNVMEGNYQSDAYFFGQYMAQKHGFVCATIDPRGMSGYGAMFEKANFQQVGKPQVEDLVDGVKHLVANYGVDTKKVGIHGWSFGGFQTQMCLYTEPDVFAVGIAGAGPTEWENYNAWYSTGTIDNSRLGQPDLSKYSLLPLAKNLKSRLLLVHGMEDNNVLYQDTIRVYRALLQAGKGNLVDLFLDPTGGHGLGGDIDRLAKAKKYEEYLVRFLGEVEPKQETLPNPREIKKEKGK